LKDPIRRHIRHCMEKLGIKDNEEGHFYLYEQKPVMSLMDESS